jgi:hypothetical protein
MDLESDKRQNCQRTERSSDCLTDEELTQLRKAEEDLKRAQAAYDKLKPLRRKRISLFWRRRMRERRAPTAQELETQKRLAEEKITEQNQCLREESQKRSFIYSVQRDYETPSSPEELCEFFYQIGSLDQFAQQIRTTRRSAMQLLKSAGLDVVMFIAKEWEAGMSLRALSHKHGPTPQTISNWVKSTGRRIKPRNSNQRYDLSRMSELFSKKWSTNKIAKEMKLSWATVQKARVEC